MMTDTVLREEGMKVLSDKLGLLDAERFITLIMREQFDYTKWQENLYDNLTLKDLCKKADDFWKTTHSS